MIRQIAAWVFASATVSGLCAAQTPTPSSAVPPPIRVGGSVRAPEKVRTVPPVYPRIAVAARQEGVVILELTIDRTGGVEAARVIRSVPLLDQAALDAVYQWEYTPTLLNGVAVPLLYNVTVAFTLPIAGASPTADDTPAPPSATAPPPAPASTVSTTASAAAAVSAVRVGNGVPAPVKIVNVAPIYPALAQRAGVTGTVILELLVDAQGTVADARVIRSVPLLDAAALTAVRQWLYEPVRVNDVPTPVYYNVTVTFAGGI